jgi:hypothetical protein
MEHLSLSMEQQYIIYVQHFGNLEERIAANEYKDATNY